MGIILQLLLVVVLIFINGFFVASEFALVSVRKTRINELVKRGNRSAFLVLEALNNLNSFISLTQLGVTAASIALGWVGEPVLVKILLLPLSFSHLPENVVLIYANVIATLIAFIVITFLHIVLGELAPKTIALQRSEKVSQIIINPLNFFYKIFSPFIRLLTWAGNQVLKIFGLPLYSGRQLAHSEAEIKMILTQSAESGAIDKREAEMVYKVFTLGDTQVENIMIHRTDVTAIRVSSVLKDIYNLISTTPYSRFPVFENSIDSILGFVHIKDVYKAMIDGKNDKSLSELEIIRRILYVPNSRRADDVLVDMRRKRIHIAVVMDDHGGTAGIVCLEDIIEHVVGDIRDEFEEPTEEIRQEKDHSFLIEGTTNIDRVKSKFNIPIKGQGFTTIGGLIYGLLGREPRKNDLVQIGDIQMLVESVEGRRIKTLRLKKI